MSLPQDCPVGPRKRRSKKAGSEAEVLRDCLKLLRDDPRVVYVERRNSGAVQFEDGGFIRFGSKGAADIWCLIRRKKYCGQSELYELVHVEIEVKRADGKGRQSAVQKEFQEFCDNHDIPYILVKSTNELKVELNRLLG